MIRLTHNILRLMVVAILLLAAVARASGQDTVYAGQSTNLGVVAVSGDTYQWELYNDVTGVNFVTTPGNCPASAAYFTAGSTGASVNVMWLQQGTYFYKVTARRGSCTMNLKVGKMTVLWNTPTATIESPPPLCVGEQVHLRIHLTGTPPWSFTLTDGTNSWIYNNIFTNPYDLIVPVTPTVTTTYWISSVSDLHLTNTVPSATVIQIIHPKPVNSKIYQYKP